MLPFRDRGGFMRTAERTGFYKDEPWRAISSDRKRKDFFNNPKNWFVTKAQLDFLRIKVFDHYGVSVMTVEVNAEREIWCNKIGDLVPIQEWQPINAHSYFVINDKTIGYSVTGTQVLEMLKKAYMEGDDE